MKTIETTDHYYDDQKNLDKHKTYENNFLEKVMSCLYSSVKKKPRAINPKVDIINNRVKNRRKKPIIINGSPDRFSRITSNNSLDD